VRSVAFKHFFLITDVWYPEVIAVLKLLITVHNLARIFVFFADLRWLLLGWLLATTVCQMVTASTVLQPLSDGDKEALAGYFVADADGFYGRCNFYLLVLFFRALLPHQIGTFFSLDLCCLGLFFLTSAIVA
jgi:hypothetical protein